ncbi:MAG: lytic transglycosylase domain-containing protein [Candidatus Margulisbacteria bacterium]|nr:lytic transglycosylase domain-containing protein [Candidatus Margulisiibacteriota bacterium]
MATVFFVSAFVWFLFMSEPNSKPVPPHQPSHLRMVEEAKGGTKQKLLTFIQKSNPKLSKEDGVEIAYWIDEYSKKEGVDPMLVAALINRESSFNKAAISQTGAKGLGQIKSFNFDSLGIDDPYNIKQNVRGTVTYLKHLFTLWKGSANKTRLALASYYQGPNATKKKQDNMPEHVTNYVDDIIKRYQDLNPSARSL